MITRNAIPYCFKGMFYAYFLWENSSERKALYTLTDRKDEVSKAVQKARLSLILLTEGDRVLCDFFPLLCFSPLFTHPCFFD